MSTPENTTPEPDATDAATTEADATEPTTPDTGGGTISPDRVRGQE